MSLSDEDKKRIELEEAYRAEARANAEAKTAKKKDMGCGQGCLVIFLLLIGGCVAMRMLTPEAPPKTAEQIAEDANRARVKACSEPFSAIREAQESVKRTLKSPTTAKFPGTFLEPHKETSAIPGKDCSWTVQSYVNAQNSFGAMIRSRWQVKMQLQSMNTFNNPVWNVTDVEVQ